MGWGVLRVAAAMAGPHDYVCRYVITLSVAVTVTVTRLGWGVQRVAAALAGVQAQVAKEQVVWRAGPLVMAPLVQSSLAASQVTGV